MQKVLKLINVLEIRRIETKRFIIEITDTNNSNIPIDELQKKILEALPNCYISIYEAKILETSNP